MVMHEGDSRTRAFTVTTFKIDDNSQDTYDFVSSGETTDYESFELGSQNTHKLFITPADPNYYDWLSINEVRVGRHMVCG